MKKCSMLMVLALFLLCTLCGCHRGPYPVPLSQPLENVVKVDIIDSRKDQGTIDTIIDFDEFVIYTLTPEQMGLFLEELQTVGFYIPMLEPTRQLGEIAVRIHYKDGYSDVIGLIHNEYIDGNQKIIDRGVSYPNRDDFLALVSRYVGAELLPIID